MAGIAGIVNTCKKIDRECENVQKMINSISHRGQGSQKVKNGGYAVLGAASKATENREKQNPVSFTASGNEITICFDGIIYNSDEVASKLKLNSVRSGNVNDDELVLLAYLKWGAGCVHYLNGIFAFAVWNSNDNELFLARDRFGIKPLYYTICSDYLIFASEIKAVLSHPFAKPVIDKNGICEVMGLGPAQTQGTGIFENICEIPPAFCATYNKNGFSMNRYWNLVSAPYEGSYEDCRSDVKRLTESAINRQLCEKDRNLCFFLSGGLDSSIITALAAKKMGYGINTFSLRYKGNEDFFEPNEYQPASDDYFINLMSETFSTNHHIVTVDNDALLEHLFDAMKARDLPGMADVDSSLYFLCKEMGKEFSGAVSGECADEVFGGYPWFHRKEDFEANIFPWARNIELRRNLINPECLSPDMVSDYIQTRYNESIARCPALRSDSDEEKRRREISYLNLNWFMYTLGARSERIGMNCGLEIRMPFCDYKLVEYLWNVPWEYKAYHNREKGLLRMCFDDTLPDEILWRKKSPFPKTHNPEYENMVKEIAGAIINDKNSPVSTLVNTDYIRTLIESPSDYGKPWFGQLMALPQLYAYIIQLDMWLKEYKIEIKI